MKKKYFTFQKNNLNAKVTFIFDDLGVCLTRLRESKMFFNRPIFKIEFLFVSNNKRILNKPTKQKYNTNKTRCHERLIIKDLFCISFK